MARKRRRIREAVLTRSADIVHIRVHFTEIVGSDEDVSVFVASRIFGQKAGREILPQSVQKGSTECTRDGIGPSASCPVEARRSFDHRTARTRFLNTLGEEVTVFRMRAAPMTWACEEAKDPPWYCQLKPGPARLRG